MIRRVVIIGSGNLAEALARAVSRSGVELVQIFARNRERGEELAAMCGTAWSDNPAELAEAEIYILAVSDRAIADLAACLPLPASAIIAHTAGSVAMDALGEKYSRRAVFYPVQTFTKGREVDFRGIPIFLECADEGSRDTLEEFARQLSERVAWSSGDERRRIHLAAVFVCNFVNRLYAIGDEIAASAGLSFDDLKPLIAETAAKALSVRHPASVQTGPAVRGDRPTMERHTAMLDDDLTKEIYSKISESIWETSKRM